jgi:hypothetical protein
MNMNDPKECPTRMETPIRLLEKHLNNIALDPNETDQMNRAIALLKAHQSLCQCGPMPDDQNASLWVLEANLATHEEFHKAYKGTPKGELHLRCIREIEDALTILRNGMEAPKESPVKKIGWGFSSDDPVRTVDQFLNESSRSVGMRVDEEKKTGLTFSEALEALKRGKKVRRGASGITLKGGVDMDLNVSFGDIATDWSIMEELEQGQG